MVHPDRMVRRSRQSSFGVHPDPGTERPEDRPGYRRNATTMSKLSRRGNTSARENIRDSNISQFTGQISSHGIHLHVRVTAHPNAQTGQKQTTDAVPRSNVVQFSPGTRNPETVADERLNNSGRHHHAQVFENDTGMVTNVHAPYGNGRESRRSQQRRLPQEAILPPIDGGLAGIASHRGHGDFPILDMSTRQASFGTPNARSPVNKPVPDKHGRYLSRDKTVSTMDSVKLPDCSPVASGIRRKRKKRGFIRDPKDRALNGKIPENVSHQYGSLNDLTRKLQIGNETDLYAYETVDRQTLERSHENLDEEWKRYSSLGSNAGQEPLSIRKKIEQFKKWHESQNKEIPKRLEQGDTETASGKENVKIAAGSETDTLRSPGETASLVEGKTGKNRDSGTRLPEVHSKTETVARPKSARTWITWKTWRGVNESYAYNDAKKYIEENELMTDEKEDWIRKWVEDVDREFFSNRGTDVDWSVSGGSSGGATV